MLDLLAQPYDQLPFKGRLLSAMGLHFWKTCSENVYTPETYQTKLHDVGFDARVESIRDDSLVPFSRYTLTELAKPEVASRINSVVAAMLWLPAEAVLDNPHEDAPRLAYADWCDRRNAPDPPPDPRGEFIRLQLKLAGEKDESFARLTDSLREKELLDAFEALNGHLRPPRRGRPPGRPPSPRRHRRRDGARPSPGRPSSRRRRRRRTRAR